MTDQELHDLIFADATAKAMADAGNDSGAAARATDIALKTLAESRQTYLSLAREVGMDATRRLKETMTTHGQSDVLIGEMEIRLRDQGGGVDVGHASTRTMLDQFAAATAGGSPGYTLTQADADAIKALGLQAPRITADDVSRVWLQYRPNGKVQ